LQECRSQEAQSFGVVFALTELIKPLSNCPGLSEAQQLEFIEVIDTSRLPPTDIHTLEGDWFFSSQIPTPGRVGKRQTLSCPTSEKPNRGPSVRR
jgi:hypothetical protein